MSYICIEQSGGHGCNLGDVLEKKLGSEEYQRLYGGCRYLPW